MKTVMAREMLAMLAGSVHKLETRQRTDTDQLHGLILYTDVHDEVK